MIREGFGRRMLTLLGWVLGVLVLTMFMLTFVQAGEAVSGISITKEPNQTVAQGSTATFNITIANTSGLTLTNVTVTDGLAPNCGRTFPELAAGDSESYSCSISNVTESFVNSATVTGTLEGGGVVNSTDTASVRVVSSGIQIIKTANPTVVKAGDTVSYTISVDNTGDSDLASVKVEDGLADCSLAGPAGDDGDEILQVDETWIYTCSITAGDQDIINTAVVTATDEVGGLVTDGTHAAVDVVRPGIQISKTPDTQTVTSGSPASFTVIVTNSGDTTLRDLIVSDPQAPACNRTFDRLWAGEHTSPYVCTVANVTDGFINSAMVTGTISKTGEDVAAVDAAKVRLDETLPCPAGMLAYWKLDESGGSAYDDFYYGLDGGCASRCPAPATGQVGGAQEFNGSDTGIDVAAVPGDDSFNWGKDDSFSVEFWMRTHSGSTCAGNEVVVGRADTAAWWVGCRDGGALNFYLKDRGGVYESVSGPMVTDGEWHHVVAVRDAGTDELRLYLDGSLEGAEPARYYDDFGAPGVELNIGWLDRGAGYHFDGLVDDVVIYERVLTGGEIWQHYNEGLAHVDRCAAGPYAPTIVSTPVTEASVGRPYSYDVEAVGDPDPTYALLTYPDGMSIDPATGLISWTPVLGQEGGHPVVVEAGNSAGADTQDFTVEVEAGTRCPEDMLAYWKLDETSGITFDDFYYYGHDGTCVAGGCPTPVPGVINGGQEFNGVNTGIDVPAHADFDWGAGDSFSIELWMRTDSSSTCAGNEVVMGRSDTSAWWVGCQDGGASAFYLRDATSKSALVTGAVITDGDWHHVVAVRDADADEVLIYVDGAEAGSESAVYSGGFGSTSELNIGWLDVPGRYRFDGRVDEVALYGRALSASEIQQHYDDGGIGPGYCVTPGIEVEKTVSPTLIYAGDGVVYTYAVTNTGDASLSPIDRKDDKCAPLTFVGGDGDSDNVLDPGETWMYSCAMAPTADITNTVIFTGHLALGDPVSDTDVAFVNVINPKIAIDKVAYPTLIDGGTTVTVTYTYTVTNPGDDPLSLDVVDDKCSPVDLVSGDTNLNARLDPSEMWVHTCSAAISVDTTNEATATVTDSLGHTWVATDTASVTVKYRIFLPIALRD